MMEELISRLVSKGIRIGAGEENLRIQVGRATLTAADKQELKNFKPDIIRRLQHRKVVSMSYAQERIWLLAQLGYGSQYHLSDVVRIKGHLQVEALKQAIDLLVHRHESLRTAFWQLANVTFQVIEDKVDFQVEETDLSMHDSDIRERKFENLVNAFIARPFALESASLMRILLVKMSADEYVLGLCMHEIICDGKSARLLLKELNECYSALSKGETPDFKPLKMQYAGYAAWQRETESEEALQPQLEYWKKYLANYQDLDLPTDFPRPGKPKGGGGVVSQSLSDELKEKLKTLASQQHMTIFSVFTAATYLLLTKYSRQKDICFGTPVANRDHQELTEMVGSFANTLILRLNVEEDLTVLDFLTQVGKVIAEAQENQHVPVEKVFDFIQPRRDLSRTPVFQVMIDYEKKEAQHAGFGECSLENIAVEQDVARYDLTIGFTEQPDGAIDVRIEYATDLFEEASVLLMQQKFINLLDVLCEHPSSRISTLSFSSEAEAEQVLNRWNDTDMEVPAQCIHDLFEQVAKSQPQATALIRGHQEVTYQELLERSGRLANYLQTKYGTKQIIGVSITRSPEMIVSVMAILMSGNAYLPLDPTYPADRLQHMMTDCDVEVIITDQHIQPQMKALTAGHVDLLLPEEKATEIAAFAPTVPQRDFGNNTLAYIIYTSGSTGLPKGVKVTHGNVVNHNYACIDIYNLTPADRVMQFSTINFDIFVEEVFPTLLCGASLVLLDQERFLNIDYIREIIKTKAVSVVNWPTAFWNSMSEEQFTDTALRMAIIGGEKAEVTYYKKWNALNPNVKVMNAYGPTETTVMSMYHEIGGDLRKNIPIGKPLANTQVYVMDEQMRPQPVGILGELYIAGDGVSAGYLNRDELTKERFLKNPFRGGKMYRTGDLVRWLPNGYMEFLGRVDQQVKIRGFRIELGEIENALLKYDGVEAAVVVAPQSKGGKQLIAYCKASQSLDEGELKRFMLKNVPDYMVPLAFIALEEIPMTPGGKVNRRALTDREVNISGAAEFVAPETATERQVAQSWKELLDAERIGIYDDFFEIGGNSMLAAQLLFQLNKDFNCALSLTQLFEHTTVEELSELLDDQDASETVIDEVEEMEVSHELKRLEQRPAQIPLSYAQERLWFLAELGQSDQYHIPNILDFQGTPDVELVRKSFEYLIGRHESLRTCLRKDKNGEPYQLILDHMEVALHHLIYHGAKYDDPAMIADLEKFVKQPFDFENGPLIRVIVLELSAEKFMMGYCMHHIIGDGWSVDVMQKELAIIYPALQQGKAPQLPPLPLQFADYAIWQKRTLSANKLAQKVQHWKAHLSGHQDINMPVDFERPEVLSGKGDSEILTLNQIKTDWMKKYCKEQNITLFSFMLSIVYALLNRYCNQDDICVGIPIANRNHKSVEGLIGFFANTVVNRVVLGKDITMEELVMMSQRELLRSQDYQDVPFSKVVDAVNPPRDGSKTPICQVLVNYVNVAAAKGSSQEQPKEERVKMDYANSKFDLDITFSETASGSINVNVEYSTDLFLEATIKRFLRHYEILLENVIRQPEVKVSEVNLETNVEKQTISGFHAQNSTEWKPKTIHATLAIDQLSAPDRTAVTDAHRSITYAELVSQADHLAHRLIQLGVTKGQNLGICMERSCEMVIAALAILKAGGVCVPINVDHPETLKAHIIKDSAINILLTDEDRATDPVLTAVPHLLKVNEALQEVKPNHQTAPAMAVSPTDPAYVIYHASADAKPVGVLQLHQTITNLADFQEQDWPIEKNAADRFGQFAAAGADVFIQELFTALLKLQQLVIIPSAVKSSGRELVRFVADQQLQYLFLPAAYLDRLAVTAMEMKVSFPQLKKIIVAGEVLNITRSVRAFFAQCPQLNLVNQYGAPETQAMTQLTLPEDVNSWKNRPTIGKPVPNVKLHILNESMTRVPLGGIGEIYISGSGLAMGYVNNAGLTAEKFVYHPQTAETLYKTGDLGRWLSNGEIECFGPLDEQVKVKGYLVVPADVENAICDHPEVTTAAVKVIHQQGGKQLAGYYTAKSKVNPLEIKQLLQKELPDYMQPAGLRQVDEIPLDFNGRVDSKQLPAIELAFSADDQHREAQSTLQKTLVNTWKKVLGLKRVGLDDNFFEVGGHSLLAVKLVSSINKSLDGLELKVMDILKYPTVAGLAKFLGSDTGNKIDTPYILEYTETAANFIVPGMPGLADGYHDMSTRLHQQEGGVYGLQMKGFFGEQPLTTIEEMAAHNLSLIGQIHSGGKLNLYAHSYGGTVTYEMLHQLNRDQYEVGKVVFLDSTPHTISSSPTEEGMIAVGKGVLLKYGLKDEAVFKSLNQLIYQYEPDRWKHVLSDFLKSHIEAFDPEFFSRMLDTLMQSMAAEYQLKGAREDAIQLVIPNGSIGITDERAWDGCFREVDVINTTGDHFSMVSSQYCTDWIKKLAATPGLRAVDNKQ